MKKKMILIGVLVVLVVSAFCIVQLNNHEVKVETSTFEGKVTEVLESSIQVRDSQNDQYLFERNDDITSGAKMLVGDDITIEYQGELDKENTKVQEVVVIKIVLKAVDVKNVNDNPDKQEPTSTTKDQPTTQSETISDMIKDMTLEEKVAQMFFVRCPDSKQEQFVKEYQIGGYILFGQDLKGKSKQQVINNIKSYQSASKIPMLIGTDEEGGTVCRVSTYFRKSIFESPQQVFKKSGYEGLIKDAKEKSAFLQEFGINVNFAPVSDVSTNSKDFIYKRAFGKKASETAKYVRDVVEAMAEVKEGSVLKHFPGYGNNKDTHTEICHDDRSYNTFTTSDFVPFEEGINAGADSVLVSHNIVKCIDAENPSSLSLKCHEILRNDLGFNGVIMTDDLMMEGVRKLDTDENIAVKAVLAGNDMLLSSDPEVQIKAVIAAVKNKTISENQIDHSVMRVLTWKEDLGLIKVSQ